MACCVLAAFILAQFVVAWRWIRRRVGGAPGAAAAALWCASEAGAAQASAQPSARSFPARRRSAFRSAATTAIIWIACIGAAGAVATGALSQHRTVFSNPWCAGVSHER